MKNTLAAMAAATLLAACGGGGESTPAALAALQGLWIGTSSEKQSVIGLVLGDGTYYVLLSTPRDPTDIRDVVQGTSFASAGAWTSTDTKDFNYQGGGVLSASLAGSYTAKQLIGGVITYPPTSAMPRGAAITFSATYDASYETAPTLSALSGLYSGDFMFAMGRQAATVSIAESGAVSVEVGTSGCSATGTATSRTDANAYNLSLTFGPAPCKTANQSFNGIAYFNAATKRLYATAQNAARTDGVLFVGTKP